MANLTLTIDDDLLTEDLQHGFAFGSLRVENPFL